MGGWVGVVCKGYGGWGREGEGGRGCGSRGSLLSLPYSAPTQTTTPLPGSSRSPPVSSTSDTLKRLSACASDGVTPSSRSSDTLIREVTLTSLPGAWDRIISAPTSGVQRPGETKLLSARVMASELVLPSMYSPT